MDEIRRLDHVRTHKTYLLCLSNGPQGHSACPFIGLLNELSLILNYRVPGIQRRCWGSLSTRNSSLRVIDKFNFQPLLIDIFASSLTLVTLGTRRASTIAFNLFILSAIACHSLDSAYSSLTTCCTGGCDASAADPIRGACHRCSNYWHDLCALWHT